MPRTPVPSCGSVQRARRPSARWSRGGDVPASSVASAVLPITPLRGFAFGDVTSPHVCAEGKEATAAFAWWHRCTGVSWLLEPAFASRLCPCCPKSWLHPAELELTARSTPWSRSWGCPERLSSLVLPTLVRPPRQIPPGIAGNLLCVLWGVSQASVLEQDVLTEAESSVEVQCWECEITSNLPPEFPSLAKPGICCVGVRWSNLNKTP